MAINLDIIASVKGLKNLLKVEKTLKKLNASATKGFSKATAKVRQMNGALAANNKFLSRSADRVGFMAFQFTFLEGIAQRVLGSIKRAFTEVLNNGADGVDAMTRAVAQSGIDFQGTTKDSVEAVQHLNDAIMTLGGGDTLFNIEEVSEAMLEIGKATDLTGTALEKSRKLVGVTAQVLRIMTLEEVDAAEAAKGLIKTMNNFELGMGDATEVISTLINVNQSSAITLDELTRSMSFASSGAKDLGLDIGETAALIGLLGNRIGQGAGAVGRNFRQLTAGLKANALKVDPILKAMGVSLLDDDGKIKPFLQFLDETRTAFQAAGESSDAFKLHLQQALGLEIRAGDLLSKLLDVSKEEIEKMVNMAKTGDSSLMEAAIGKTPKSSIKKLKAAVNALEVMFAGGLAPALVELTKIMKELVRDTGLQEMAMELGSIIGLKIIPIVRVLSGELKKLTNFFRENKLILDLLINSFVVFIGLMVSLLIIASVGKVVAAFMSLLLKLTLVMGTGQVAATGFSASLRAVMIPLLTLVAIFAGIIVAALAFKNVLKLLTDDIPNEMQGMEFAVSGSLVAIGVAFAAVLGGPVGLAAALVALAAVAVAVWADQIGALDAFSEKWDEVFRQIEEQDMDGLSALFTTFSAWAQAMEAMGFKMGQNIGMNIYQAIATLKESLDETDFGKLWEAFSAGNLIEALSIGAKIAKSLVDGFVGLIEGVLGIRTSKEIANIPSAVLSEANKAGIAAGEALRKAFIEGFTTNLTDSIINAIAGAFGPVLGPLIKGILTGITDEVENQAFIDGVNESDFDGKIDPNRFPTITGVVPMIREGTEVPAFDEDGNEIDPVPKTDDTLGEAIITAFDINGENPIELLMTWAEETVVASEPMVESIEDLGEETLPILQTKLEENSESFELLTNSVNLLTDGVHIQTEATNILSKAKLHNSVMTNILSAKEVLLHDIMDETTLQFALETNQIIELQKSTNAAALAMQKMAIEGTEVSRRLSTLTVSKRGNFSMDSHRTNTDFSNIKDLQSGLGHIIATDIGQAINIEALKRDQAATVNVGGINIVIEGNANPEELQEAIDELQDRLNKDIGNKNTVLAVRG